jgi:hypothetical protein
MEGNESYRVLHPEDFGDILQGWAWDRRVSSDH